MKTRIKSHKGFSTSSKKYYPIYFTFFFLLCANFLTAQLEVKTPDHHRCELPATYGDEPISKPYIFRNKEENDNEEKTLNFTINFLAAGSTLSGNTCTTWPADAQTAFTYAASIWSDVLENDQNIGIDACWATTLPAGTLGSAGPTNFLGLSSGTDLPLSFFPVALAEHLLDGQQGAVDIRTSLNAGRTDWYFGTDANPPFSEFDFVSVVVHELGHGLGFLGGSAIDDGDALNGDECDGVAGNGCIGLLSGGSFIPTIYDQFVDIDDGTGILNLTNPSADVATVLVGGTTTAGAGGLDFDGTNIDFFGNETTSMMKLNTPATYQSGSSYSHFDEITLGAELMSPSITNGQAIHDPGMATLVMLEMGWSAPTALPVTLTTFEGKNADNAVFLKWQTASELNNDYFSIERSVDGSEFSSIGIIRGSGTRDDVSNYSFIDYHPLFGKNYYRLKQFDLDKGFAYSKIIVIDYVDESGGVALFPNPTNGELNLYFNHIPSDNSVVFIHSTNGQLLAQFDLANIENQQLVINVANYPKGTYFVKIIEAGGLTTQKFTKI